MHTTDPPSLRSAGRDPSARRVAAVAALVAVLAAGLALGAAQALRPPGYFAKYLQPAEFSPQARRAREADFSPLYLEVASRVVPRWGAKGLLLLNVLAHAAVSAAVAATVGLGAGWKWGLAAGVAVASFRPFLVYTAVLEPELLLLALLGVALWAATLARRNDRRILAALTVGICLGVAALARPSWLLMVPAGALWIAWPQQQRWRVGAGLAVLVGGVVVVAPLLVQRWWATGQVVLMNPGPVLYEGNGPQALGAPGTPPELVKLLEAQRGEGGDWAHVGYRQVAAEALGRAVSPAESNRYWAQLALEFAAAEPALVMKRCLKKLAYALGPFEFHDLPEAVELDRRLRPFFPWGFGVLVVLAVGTGAVRWGWTFWGPAAVAFVSLSVQVVFYASARQRLPLALALLVLIPLAAARFGNGAVRRFLPAAGVGMAAMLLLAWVAAPLAGLREAQLSTLLGAPPPGKWAAWFDGRAWRPEIALAAERVVLAPFLEGQSPASLHEHYLAPALRCQEPFLRGRARWQLAQALAREGRREEALAAACASAIEAPGLLRAQALCAVGRGEWTRQEGESWRPAGVDPVSARFALAWALVALGHREAGWMMAEPLLVAFPELTSELLTP